MKEKTLSEKEMLLFDDEDWIKLEDIKEFIKRLKEIWTIEFIDFEKKVFKKGLLDEQIDKLAGDKLIK